MIFKEDWEDCKKRFNAFWEGEIIDRCCLSVTAPKTDIPFRQAKDPLQKWMDLEFRYEEAMYYFANTFFGGEAFPMFWNNLGPGLAASFVGSGFKLAEDTIWFDVDPIIKDWSNMPDIQFKEDSIMWKKVWEMTHTFLEESKDNYHVGITDLGGNMDIAVSLRGNEKLLYDLIDHPEEVKTLLNKIDEIWYQAYDKLQTMIENYVEGSSAWMGIWCEKRWYPLQCDFSSMISTQMFNSFVKPLLQKEADFMDFSIYHLDGPGQIGHLDSLLEINNINGIQCVPGETINVKTGKAYSTYCTKEWLPVYKRIQESGKNLVLNGVNPEEIDELLEYLSPKGLFISTSCRKEEDAKYLLKKAEKWSAITR